ncbi:hypothetical protein D3C81_1505520 [compost metagenome]
MVIQRGAQEFFQLLGVMQVGDADAATRHLVFVGRADATAGGADRLAAGSAFARLVQGDVVRHDQRRGRGDLQARTHFHAGGFQLGDFLLQRGRRDHHAVADQAQRIVTQDARRDQVQDGLLAVDDQGVAGIVAALEAHDRADFLSEQIDDLALAFIAPLGTKHYDRLTHDGFLYLLRPSGPRTGKPQRGWPALGWRLQTGSGRRWKAQTRKKPNGEARPAFVHYPGFRGRLPPF